MPSQTSPRALLCASLCLVSLTAAPLSAQARDPQDFVLAIGLLQRGLHEEAAGTLRAFLREHPDHRRSAEAWYRLGKCQLELSQRDEAVQSFSRALRFEDFELRPESHYQRATTLQGMEQHGPALESYDRLLAEVPDDHYLRVAASFASGECLRDLRRDEEALARFVRTARIAGDEKEFAFSSLYQGGFVLLRLDRPSEAADAFDLLAEQFPEHEGLNEIHYLRGESAYRAGAFERAEAAWGVCMRDPGEFADEALSGLAWCNVELGRPAESRQLFERLIREHGASPMVPAARLELGRLLQAAGEHERAAAELQTLLSTEGIDPELRASALELRGLALLETGDSERALQSFQTVMSSDADVDSARIQYHLGETLTEQEQYEPALQAYQQAAANTEDAELRGDALYAQALVLHRMSRFAESSQQATILLREHSEHRLVPLARFAIAENLFAQGEYPAALRAYDALPSDHPSSAQARYKGAWSTYLSGDPATAAQRFAAIVEDEGQDAATREEALSMRALTLLEAEQGDAALEIADLYRSRYPEGRFVARTERIAGRVLKQKGDFRGSAQRLAIAAQAESSGERAAELRIESADAMFRQGNFEDAQAIYAELAQREDLSGARALVGLSWCAFELGDGDACLSLSERGLSHPEIGDEAPALMELQVTVQHRAERWQSAAESAQRFLRTFPEHARVPELRYALGVAQARGGDLDAARGTLSGLAQDGGAERMDRVYYELAWVCRRAEDEPAALAAFGALLENSEDRELLGESRLHLGEAALARGDADRGRELLRAVEGKSQGAAFYRLGFSLMESEEFGPATQAFEAVVGRGEAEPLAIEASFMAAEAYMREDKVARARQHLERLLAKDPENARAQRARLYLGECLVRGEEPAQAIAVLDDFLRRGGDQVPAVERARAQLWNGRARQARGEQEEAERAFRKVTDLSEGQLAAEAQYRIGETRRARRELEDAVDAYVKLSILYAHEPWVPMGLLRAAECYEELQQPAKATKFYQELLERFPDSDQAKTAKEKTRGV